MKIKYHRPIFIAAVICAAALLALHWFELKPQDSLYDYALTLADGIFVSEAGTLWQAAETGADDRIYAELIGEVENTRFKTDFDNSGPEELLPHELAMALSDYGRIFIDNDGVIWRSVDDPLTPQRVTLRPFLAPGEPSGENSFGELNVLTETSKYYKQGQRFHIDHHNVEKVTIKYQFIGPSDSGPLCRLYIKLGDTWYKSMSTDLGRAPYEKAKYSDSVLFQITDRLPGFAFNIDYLSGPYDILCRAEVTNSSGELLAARNFDMFSYDR